MATCRIDKYHAYTRGPQLRAAGAHTRGWVTSPAAYLVLVPAARQIDMVVEEAGHASLHHLMLHVLEQVGEPLEGVRVRTDPVEVNLAQLHVEVRVTVLVPAS